MLSQKHALIISENPLVEDIQAIKDIGYEVDLAVSAQDAAEKLSSESYTIVVFAPELLREVSGLEPCHPEHSSSEVEWQMMLADVVANSTQTNLAYLDPNFTFVWVNSAFADTFGFNKERMIGRSYFELLPNPDDAKIFEDVRDTGLPYTAEEKPLVNPKYPDKVTYWNWNIIPIRHQRDPIGTTRGFALAQINVTHDVQARRDIEQLRQRAEKQAQEMSAIFEALTDAVIVYDPDGNITYANHAVIKAYGVDPKSSSNREMKRNLSIRRSDGQPEMADQLPSSRALRGETVVDEQYSFINSEGREFTILASASPIITEGKVSGAVAIWHDITELKKAQQRELETEAQKREFFSKTILAATNGKLVVTEKEEIRKTAGPAIKTWELRQVSELAKVRQEASEIANSAGMEKERFHALLSCLGEAMSNAIKHAHDATASIHRNADGFIFVVEDKGKGIDALSLPDVALIRGYSTAGTGGMGYKMIISCANKVYLATGPEGTTVAFEIKLQSQAYNS